MNVARVHVPGGTTVAARELVGVPGCRARGDLAVAWSVGRGWLFPRIKQPAERLYPPKAECDDLRFRARLLGIVGRHRHVDMGRGICLKPKGISGHLLAPVGVRYGSGYC